MSSSLVLSGPSASAMVESREIAFKRSKTSSCYSAVSDTFSIASVEKAQVCLMHTLSSSMRTAIG
jgi:hypothetical protein